MTQFLKPPRLAWLVGVLAIMLAVPIAGGLEPGSTRLEPGTTKQDQTPRGGQRGSGSRTSVIDALGPNFRWWRDEETAADLGLTPEQVAAIDEIYQERQTALGGFIREYVRQDAATAMMAEARTASVGEFSIQVASHESLRAKLNESRTIMLYRMVLELDDEQYAKLRDVRDRRARGGRGGRGSGGRNGPDR